MKMTLEAQQFQQAKETGRLALGNAMTLDVRFFLLDRTYPPAQRPAIIASRPMKPWVNKSLTGWL